jgi:hypothetical protein
VADRTIELAPVAFDASRPVLAALARIGRTEDVQISPDGTRLALPGFLTDRLLVVDLAIDQRGGRPGVTLSDCVEIESADFHAPHGISWLDDETAAIGNREGNLLVLSLPKGRPASEARVICEIGAGDRHLINTPGSLLAAPVGMGLIELLVCNNYVNYVSRHLIDRRAGHAVLASEILLADGIEVPDNVALSPSRRWIAISNHDRETVLLYRYDERLNPASRPEAVLTGAHSPHGLHFVGDDGLLMVADAGAPYVHFFASVDGEWDGEYAPIASIRVLSDATFQRGNFNPTEGGPKGLDLTADRRLMVVTCAEQTLAFFDLAPLLATVDRTPRPINDIPEADRVRATMARHLLAAQARATHEGEAARRGAEYEHHELARARREIAEMKRSRSWRITSPLRSLNGYVRKITHRG